ncbi:stage II sporulation protein R [Paenibacillus thailandensis]|uniref:Stage II sporulation protein R n=1 Tax=Paenibacillus thailandensis TaxID=393250 RepID=A0ABW5R4K8_9BACL
MVYTRSYSRPYTRFPYRRSYGLIAFILILLVMSWESQKNDAAAIGSSIPDESIRLRILAHSDAPADQAVKRVVRDEIVAAMNGWAAGPQTIEEARETIRAHMPEIEAIVADVLESRGFDYSFETKLGMVEFPTKMYGNEVYPAGEYEALLVTLGEGQGQNWWCVLFPPLCFIDAATGEAAAASTEGGKAASASADPDGAAAKQAAAGAQGEGQGAEPDEGGSGKTEPQAPEVKFFIAELLQNVVRFVKGLFA